MADTEIGKPLRTEEDRYNIEEDRDGDELLTAEQREDAKAKRPSLAPSTGHQENLGLVRDSHLFRLREQGEAGAGTPYRIYGYAG
jgi:hypothetical protein